MKKIITIFVVTTVLVLTTLLFGVETVDLTGTWVGTSLVEEADMELTFSLILEQTGSTVTGHMKDDMGYIDSNITEAALDGVTLTFLVTAMTPDGELEMAFDVQVEGGKMDGAWEIEGMASGEWSAEKQK
jgi:hypothetical protein